ncbi:hypothetical protein HMH01_15075 [Halovulum dunhuangense]|uniref:Uncharacterized protein n=1 Tax=Halovulum dunhuangense TaxID=1505036 RepID=A0A849L6I7_9RHOB|nr:hypothetical protein [Halovulum dunhuangense]NNU81762.1 hypothetical protein [Halovulum dunhuangense]
MTDSVPVPVRPSLLGHLLSILRTATLERMILPDIEGTDIEEQILLESDLVRTPPLLCAAPKPPFL